MRQRRLSDALEVGVPVLGGHFRSRGVIIDVTVLDVIDSFATRTLRGVAHMLKLRGAETVIVGIQPDVAFAMVQLGLTLEGVGTALDLEEGLAFLNAKAKRGSGAGRAAAPLSSVKSKTPFDARIDRVKNRLK